MKLLLVLCLFLFTFQKPICCENCKLWTTVLTLKPKKCADKPVCEVQCEQCSNNRVFYIVSDESRLSTLAYYKVCIKREQIYEEEENSKDVYWKKLIQVVGKYPQMKTYIETRNLTSFKDAEKYIHKNSETLCSSKEEGRNQEKILLGSFKNTLLKIQYDFKEILSNFDKKTYKFFISLKEDIKNYFFEFLSN